MPPRPPRRSSPGPAARRSGAWTPTEVKLTRSTRWRDGESEGTEGLCLAARIPLQKVAQLLVDFEGNG